ncbi:MAG: RNA-binding protein [Planctomycetota bacterium]
MGKRLFVGNLSFNSTEDGLQAIFEQGGFRTASISIVADRDTGRSRGFAFVEMESDTDAQAAIKALDGANFDGRPLRVNEAEEKKPRGPGGGGGGGGGYGGDRRGGGGGGGGGRRERW